MKKITKLLYGLVVALSVNCTAQTLPEGLFTVGNFEIGKATMEGIQSHFGPGKLRIIEPGDGADKALCYRNGITPSSPTIVFETGALGGWKNITSYRLSYKSGSRCAQTSISIEGLLTGNGLKLLATKDAASMALNKPLPASTATTRVEQVYQKKGPAHGVAVNTGVNQTLVETTFDVVDTVEMRFKRGAIVDLYVKRLVSH